MLGVRLPHCSLCLAYGQTGVRPADSRYHACAAVAAAVEALVGRGAPSKSRPLAAMSVAHSTSARPSLNRWIVSVRSCWSFPPAHTPARHSHRGMHPAPTPPPCRAGPSPPKLDPRNPLSLTAQHGRCPRCACESQTRRWCVGRAVPPPTATCGTSACDTNLVHYEP